MDGSRLIAFGLGTPWEVGRSGNYVDRQRKSFKTNLLRVADTSEMGYHRGGGVESRNLKGENKGSSWKLRTHLHSELK